MTGSQMSGPHVPGSHASGAQTPESSAPSWGPHSIPRWAIIVPAVLLLFGLGTAIHNAGWSQGYTLGLLTGSAEGGDALTPYLVYRTGGGFHPLGFFGGIFRFLFPFLLVGLIFKFLRYGRHHRQGEHFGPWRHHDYGPHNGPQNAPQPGDRPGQATPAAEPPSTPAGSQPTVWTHV